MEIKDFSSWWEQNKKDYEQVGINKIFAKAIWNAACDTMESELTKTLLNADNHIK